MIIFDIILELLYLGLACVFGIGKKERLNVVSLKATSKTLIKRTP